MTAARESSIPVVEASGLCKRYARGRKETRRRGLQAVLGDLRGQPARVADEGGPTEFWALHDVSFQLARGEALGVVGVNGSGKSTLLRIIAGLSRPDLGSIQVNGRVTTLLGVGGFEPLETGRQAIRTSPALWGVDAAHLPEHVDRVIEFAGLAPYIDAPIRTYSQGMIMRLGFSISALSGADLIVIDEVLAVGDIEFQHRCVEHLRWHLDRGGSLIIVSHSMSALEALCTNGLFLHDGEVCCFGRISDVCAEYSELLLERESSSTYETWAISAVLNDATAESTPPHESEAPSEPVEVGDDPTHRGLLAPTHGRPVGFTSITATGPGHSEVRSLAPCCISVGYKSTTADVEVQCSISVFSSDGHVAALACLSDANRPMLLRHGFGSYRAEVDLLPLRPGAYLLRVAVLDHATQQPIGLHGWETPATRFVVEETAKHHNSGHGLLDFWGVGWSVRPLGAARGGC